MKKNWQNNHPFLSIVGFAVFLMLQGCSSVALIETGNYNYPIYFGNSVKIFSKSDSTIIWSAIPFKAKHLLRCGEKETTFLGWLLEGNKYFSCQDDIPQIGTFVPFGNSWRLRLKTGSQQEQSVLVFDLLHIVNGDFTAVGKVWSLKNEELKK